jgi:TetR/AcrR family transcriptional repressor of mexJK operon
MTAALAKSPGPGRPKDPEKRAAILDAAKKLFPFNGFDGTSMDAIAAEAGVSKLTVYSHFRDKETLFVEAVRAKSHEQMPDSLFDVDPNEPVRAQLEAIARAFLELVTSPQAIALHRLLTAGSGSSPKLAQLFWEGGPQRIQRGFQQYLQRKIAAGKLDIADVPRAAGQFFTLLKGDLHPRLLCGCGQRIEAAEFDAHIQASVDLFLRAYSPRPS